MIKIYNLTGFLAYCKNNNLLVVSRINKDTILMDNWSKLNYRTSAHDS